MLDLFMMKILVTGGAGFIGSHTVVALIEAGFEPVIVDDFSNSSPMVISRVEQICGRKLNHYQADCTSTAELNKIFEEHPDITGVIHFAAFKAVNESLEMGESYYHNNLSSLTNLCTIMRKHGVKKLVFSSSCTVYGIPDQMKVDEKAPFKEVTNPYGHTKQLGEFLLEGICKHNPDFDVVLLRYFNPVGAHPSGLIGELPIGVPSNLVPFVTQTAAGWREKLTVFGEDYETEDGTCIRDFIHVVDLANAHVKALQWTNSNGNIEAFNIGTGKGHSVKEIVEIFQDRTGVSLSHEYGNRREGDVPAIFGNTEKANQMLGWKAELSIGNALEHAWKWQQTLEKPE